MCPQVLVYEQEFCRAGWLPLTANHRPWLNVMIKVRPQLCSRWCSVPIGVKFNKQRSILQGSQSLTTSRNLHGNWAFPTEEWLICVGGTVMLYLLLSKNHNFDGPSKANWLEVGERPGRDYKHPSWSTEALTRSPGAWSSITTSHDIVMSLPGSLWRRWWCWQGASTREGTGASKLQAPFPASVCLACCVHSPWHMPRAGAPQASL